MSCAQRCSRVAFIVCSTTTARGVHWNGAFTTDTRGLAHLNLNFFAVVRRLRIVDNIIYYFTILVRRRRIVIIIIITRSQYTRFSLSDDPIPRALCVFLFIRVHVVYMHYNNNVCRYDSECPHCSDRRVTRRWAKRNIKKNNNNNIYIYI